MAVVIKEQAVKSYRILVREYGRECIREVQERGEALDHQDLALRKAQEFLQTPAGAMAVAREIIVPDIIQTFRMLAGETRRGVVVYGDEIMPREVLHERLENERPRWMTRLENSGGRYIPLGKMYKSDLALNVAARKKPTMTELHDLALKEALLKRMPDDKRVEEVFTDEEIEKLASTLRVEVVVTEEDK